MKKLIMAVCLFTLPAFADEPKKSELPPTVTLTQQELQQIIQVEVSAALTNDRARQSAAKTYAKIQEAFAPKKEDK